MNTDTEIKDYAHITDDLSKLLKQVGNSGLNAWRAGDKLHFMKTGKLYRVRFGTFEEYSKEELKITPETANKYIAIRESFEEDETKEAFISHLLQIAKLDDKNLKEIVLQTIKKNFNKNVKLTLGDVVNIVSTLLPEDSSNKTPANIAEEVNGIIVQRHIERIRSNDRKDIQNYGNELNFTYFKKVQSKLLHEPILEMGVVALFCLMFDELCEIPFSWNNKKITFNSIKYIRSKYPDACLRYYDYAKKQYFELNIEFEMDSYSFIEHDHEPSKCDVIICWSDNAKTDNKRKLKQAIMNMPPILSLKNCLETGKIELIV